MADLEKLTINVSVVDLGQIDLLVEEGLYSNRADFIRTAIRNQIITHNDVVKQSVTRKMMVVGVVDYGKEDLERYRAAGQMLEANVVGMVIINKDVTPELAQATIKSIKVLGVLSIDETVKKALGDRIK